jgi:mRNA-degrading endonuclease toxin of MazEF toxin-antitoxin module
VKPGDIVIAAFPGARITKVRPAVVLSAEDYQNNRPDVIFVLITSRSADPSCPTHCEIRDWKSSGLHAASCFRLYLVTLSQADVRVVGRLTAEDWREVQRRLRIGLAMEQS